MEEGNNGENPEPKDEQRAHKSLKTEREKGTGGQ